MALFEWWVYSLRRRTRRWRAGPFRFAKGEAAWGRQGLAVSSAEREK